MNLSLIRLVEIQAHQVLTSPFRLGTVWLDAKAVPPRGARLLGPVEPNKCDAMLIVDSCAAICYVGIATNGFAILELCLLQLLESDVEEPNGPVVTAFPGSSRATRLE